MDKKSKAKTKPKPKAKAKPNRLKPNKESSTCLNVDLWEQNEDRFTTIELPGHTASITEGTATSLSTSSAMNATASETSCLPSSTMPTPSPTAKVTIAGCDSAAALMPLDTSQSEPNEPERGNWTGRFDFLLSLLGYSVGLGNVWRFPYLCYNNGGGAFLIPFTIMLIIAGLPLMFMELSFGQYAALGPVAIYRRFCPLFRGLGTGMIIVSAIVMLYYNLIIAWTIFYMFASFRSELPWQNCETEWSTQNCFSYEKADQCDAINGTYYLRICYNTSYAEEHNITEKALHALKRPPAEEYFTNFVLGISAGIEETGGIKISLAGCLFIAWAIVFLCLCKGVQSSGKVVYFTALFPYVVLVILFFRGVTLPGAMTGIVFYLTPDFNRLANAQVWGDAAVQIFFALSPAWGGLITLSSYNKFSNNCYKDSLIVAVCNIATSFFAGLVIFSIIGFLAHELDVDVGKVVDQGAGLAFIVYPEVVTRLPVSPVWSVLFFLMLLTLGLDSQFALMETVTTAILDKFPNMRQYKTWVVLFVGIFGYIGGLGFTTNSGMYWLQLMDKYAANWSVLLIAIFECVLIAWIYGSQRFLNDIQGMIGKRSHFWNSFWSTMWRYITPATLLFILFFNWVEYKPASYGHYVYPLWADAVGWIIGLLPVLVIFLVGFQQIWKAPRNLSLIERLKHLLRPTAEWGPAGRPCVNLHVERYQSQNYDGVTNAQILINGLPSDVLTYDDNANGCNGADGDSDTRVGINLSILPKRHQNVPNNVPPELGTFRFEKSERINAIVGHEEDCYDGLSMKGIQQSDNKNDRMSNYVTIKTPGTSPIVKMSGPNILKSSKHNQSGNGKHKGQMADVSPSRQPLIEAELTTNKSSSSLRNEFGHLEKNDMMKHGADEKIQKVTATFVSSKIMPNVTNVKNTCTSFTTTTTAMNTTNTTITKPNVGSNLLTDDSALNSGGTRMLTTFSPSIAVSTVPSTTVATVLITKSLGVNAIAPTTNSIAAATTSNNTYTVKASVIPTKVTVIKSIDNSKTATTTATATTKSTSVTTIPITGKSSLIGIPKVSSFVADEHNSETATVAMTTTTTTPTTTTLIGNTTKMKSTIVTSTKPTTLNLNNSKSTDDRNMKFTMNSHEIPTTSKKAMVSKANVEALTAVIPSKTTITTTINQSDNSKPTITTGTAKSIATINNVKSTIAKPTTSMNATISNVTMATNKIMSPLTVLTATSTTTTMSTMSTKPSTCEVKGNATKHK